MNSRLGIYGGSFDPVHNGHIQAMVETARRFSLDKVVAVPAHQNPLKEKIEGPTPEQRLEMVKYAIEGYEDLIHVDDQEIARGGKSYSIETIKSYSSKYGPDDLCLILGIDAFDRFDEWKDFDQILNLCNIVVTSRPGVRLPRDVQDLPSGLVEHIALYDKDYIELKTGRNIQFVTITDITISSTELRKRLRSGRSVKAYLCMKVEEYLREHHIYEPIGDKIGDAGEFIKNIVSQLDRRRAIGIKAFDLRGLNAPADYAVIASGTSSRHARAIGEYLHQEIKQEFGIMPISLEGLSEGRWVLADYGAIIIHVFYDFVRGEYNLEELWKNGKEIPVEVSAPPGSNEN